MLCSYLDHPALADGLTSARPERFADPASLIDYYRSNDLPIYLFRPHALSASLDLFRRSLPARLLYAVKANDHAVVLKELAALGIDAFDVASLGEVRRVARVAPAAEICFMNPVKYPSDIAEAYHRYGVRTFALDSDWELEKILTATNRADDLHLAVRIAVSNDSAVFALGSKFGIDPAAALTLLESVAAVAERTSISFHVGSQCSDPDAYRAALGEAASLREQLSFRPYAIDIGGGFPAEYDPDAPPALPTLLQTIGESWSSSPLAAECRLLAEPGRALVASAFSLLCRVIGRKGNELYISDGMYGGLYESNEAFAFPVRPHRQHGVTTTFSNRSIDYTIWGPSCDSFDRLNVPFRLPEDIAIGDLVEFGHAGAYSQVFRTNFNGFQAHHLCLLDDPPF